MSKADVAARGVDAEIFGVMLKHRCELSGPHHCCSCGMYFNDLSGALDQQAWLKHLASMIAARLRELG
jgi:hypothetical protein